MISAQSSSVSGLAWAACAQRCDTSALLPAPGTSQHLRVLWISSTNKIAVGIKCLHEGGLLAFSLSPTGLSSAPGKNLKGIGLGGLMHKLQLLLIKPQIPK